MEIINNTINSIKSSLNEKMIKRELTIITHYLQNFQWSLTGVEGVLYSTTLLQTSVERKLVINRLIFLDMLDKFIDHNSKNAGTAYGVKTLYWDYLMSIYKDKYITMSEREIYLVKELIWAAYYVGCKNLPSHTTIPREGLIYWLIGGGFHCSDNMDEPKSIILRKIAANIISLKNGRADLLPYPQYASIDDVIELIELNCPGEVILKRLLQELPEATVNRENYGAFRNHYINFAVELLREKICI